MVRGTVRWPAMLIAGAAGFCLSTGLAAADEQVPPVVVTGSVPTMTDVSSAPASLPASTTVITSEELTNTPVQSYGDMLRPQLGINVANYGQGGIGYGITLRGFTDAEHGRDIAYFVDGVPINDVSSIHTPNYADLFTVIPESIDRIEIIRGPFSAEYGDSAEGGVVNIYTKQSEPFGTAGLSGGAYGTERAVGTYSQTTSLALGLEPYAALEGYDTNGYRDNQYLHRVNLFTKGTLNLGDNVFSATLQGYDSNWGAPGFLNLNAINAGLVKPTAAVNPTDGGHKGQEDIVLNYGGNDPDNALSTTVFAKHDIFARFSDFGGGQSGQIEQRETFGGTVRRAWSPLLFGAMPAQFVVGTNLRADVIDDVSGPTVARQFAGPRTLDVDVDEFGAGLFTQNQIKPFDWLKLTAGLRYDHFFYDIDNVLAGTRPSTDAGTWSPKAGIAVTPLRTLELFANYGQGFRSPDAALELLASPHLEPIKLESMEAGARYKPTSRLEFLLNPWTTKISNEIFQPAPGLPLQNLGHSRREGVDAEARYRLLAGDAGEVTLFVNYEYLRAVLLNEAPAIFVPNVPAYLANIGVEGDLPAGNGDRIAGSLYVQYVGAKHLSEDGLLKSSPYQKVAGKLAYSLAAGWTAYADVMWYPSDRNSETAFDFGSGVGDPSSDVFVGPQPRVAGFLGVTYHFNTGR